jgi:hypothetical protein
MAEKLKGWNPTCKRFVAFLDIMGFRDRVFRGSHEDVKKMLEYFYKIVERFGGYVKENIEEKSDKLIIKINISQEPFIFPVTFSDSLLLISSDDSDISIFKMFTTVACILNEAIMIGIPIKGALAHGEMTADLGKSLYIGKPLIDAYELQDELKLYGVVLHHTMERRLFELEIMKKWEDYYIFKYDVPLKNGNISHYLVNCHLYEEQREALRKCVAAFYNEVSGTPRIYVDNTMKYVNWLLDEKIESPTK